MVPSIFHWLVLQKSVLFGTWMSVTGLGLVWVLCISFPVLGRFFFQTSILQAWQNSVFAELCKREGFRGIQDGFPLFDREGSLKLLFSSHVRERDKALLRATLVGGVWNGFLLRRTRGENVPCRFCGGIDGNGHLFWDCSFPPWLS